MNYYIADMHLFCKSQTQEGRLNFDNRPFQNTEEMHKHFFQEWNKQITNADTVYILGDTSLRGRNDELIALVAQLKGKKILIKGNHDDLSDYRYKQLFHEICDYKEITDCIGGTAYKLVLSHYPILMWNGQHKGTILLYGHTHTSDEDVFFQKCLTEMNSSEKWQFRRPQEPIFQAYNVGCMLPYMNYKPRTLREILDFHTEGDNYGKN